MCQHLQMLVNELRYMQILLGDKSENLETLKTMTSIIQENLSVDDRTPKSGTLPKQSPDADLENRPFEKVISMYAFTLSCNSNSRMHNMPQPNYWSVYKHNDLNTNYR